MSMFLISYDLHKPHRDYEGLFEAIQRASGGNWAKPLESVWIIQYRGNVAQLRDALQRHVDNNDSLLVVELTGNWATFRVDARVTEWLKAA